MRLLVQPVKSNINGKGLFETEIATGGGRVWSLASSLFLHGLIAAGLVCLPLLMPAPLPRVAANRPPLEIRIGNHIYLVTRIPMVEHNSRVENISRKDASRQEAVPRQQAAPLDSALASLADAGKAVRPAARRFVPPAPVNLAPKPEQILIQPSDPPELTLADPNLPDIAIWTGVAPLRTLRRRFIEPGRGVTPSVAKLELPEAPPELGLAQTSELLGDPLDLVALRAQALELPERLLVPPGNLLPQPAGLSPEQAEALTKLAPSLQAALGSTGSAQGGTGLFGPPDIGPADSASVTFVPPARPPAKIIDWPPDGNFDSVIVQAAIPVLGEHLLKTRPVYTVYIAVESAREWTLYFCLLENASGPAPGPMIHLEPVAPVRPPWPTHLVIPAIDPVPGEPYILVHAYVTSGGRLDSLAVIRPQASQLDPALLESLASWVFRPAAKDGVPVAVEAVLAIPTRAR